MKTDLEDNKLGCVIYTKQMISIQETITDLIAFQNNGVLRVILQTEFKNMFVFPSIQTIKPEG